MTIDEALLYDAEFWTCSGLDSIYHAGVNMAILDYGFKINMTNEHLSWLCLLIREDIKC